MKTLSQYKALVEEGIRNLDLNREPKGLYAPIEYGLEEGGKRLRPVLTLAACEAVGAPANKAMNQALGVEIFHNFTLLHDDVMDKADVRRGRPAVHRKFSESSAILSGDAMLTLATQTVVTGCGDMLKRVLNLFNTTAMEIYQGQQLDMDFETRTDVKVDEYMEMIRLKTSVLLGCACAMGAIMGGCAKSTVDALYSYGEKLGLSFQLKDDWLDTYGDPATFGKEIGGDILNEKKTWLLITALGEDSSGALTDALGRKGNEKINAVREVYDTLELSQRCRALEEKYAEEAVDCLAKAEISDEAREFFTKLALDSINRTK